MKKLIFVLVTSGLFAFQAAYAANSGLKEENFYFGGGIGMNDADDSVADSPFADVDLDDATGFQIFVGYDTGVKTGPADLAVEIGYMDSGDFDVEVGGVDAGSVDATGLWATAVFDAPINKEWSALGRIGLDFGDDDGLMFGIGAGYKMNRQWRVRGEYVIRDNINSLQVNFLYHL